MTAFVRDIEHPTKYHTIVIDSAKYDQESKKAISAWNKMSTPAQVATGGAVCLVIGTACFIDSAVNHTDTTSAVGFTVIGVIIEIIACILAVKKK